MVAFARTLGFGFCAHHLGHADRKGRIERPFAYVEANFLVGRSFVDLDDLNRQALAWCRGVANQKPKRVLGMSPEAAYRTGAAAADVPPVFVAVDRPDQFEGAFATILRERVDAPFTEGSPIIYVQRARIVTFAATHLRRGKAAIDGSSRHCVEDAAAWRAS